MPLNLDKLKSFKVPLLLILLIISIAGTLFFTVPGPGRSEHEIPYKDGTVFYAAGKTWLQGGNPYNLTELRNTIGRPYLNYFLYPPSASLFCIFLTLFDLATAQWVLYMINWLMVLAIIMMNIYTIKKQEGSVGWDATFLMSTAIISLTATRTILWLGQSSLVAIGFLMAAWLLRYRSWALSGILLGMASFKPQLSLALTLWFLINRNWKILAIAIVTFFLLSLYPIFTNGLWESFREWYAALANADAVVTSKMSSPGVVGIESFLYKFGILFPKAKILTAIFIGTLWVFRKHIYEDSIFALLMVVSLTFLFTHAYDYVCLAPGFAWLWLLLRNKKFGLTHVVTLLLLTPFFIPNRMVQLTGLNLCRSACVLGIGVLLLFLSARYQSVRLALQ